MSNNKFQPNTYLDFLGQTHSPHQHARGHLSTLKMLDLLDAQPHENILEIGVGTGATFVETASRFPAANLYGIELSELMYHTTNNRLKICFLSQKVELRLQEKPGVIPFEERFFDKVYVESVLAIQQGDALLQTIAEIQRILKPGGTLLFNETIWLDATNATEIERINTACLKAFGIIQANGKYPYWNNWKTILENKGFEILEKIQLNALKPIASGQHQLTALLSRGFSLWGKFKGMLSPKMRQQARHYQQAMQTIITSDQPLMEGLLVKAKCKK